jgi:hypothetical protein
MSGDVFVPASTWPQDSVQAESQTYADY